MQRSVTGQGWKQRDQLGRNPLRSITGKEDGDLGQEGSSGDGETWCLRDGLGRSSQQAVVGQLRGERERGSQEWRCCFLQMEPV